MGVPQIGNMIGRMATGLPSRHAKYNVLVEPSSHKQRKVNKEENKETTNETKITTVKGRELPLAVQLRHPHRDGLSGYANCWGDGTKAMSKYWGELISKHPRSVMMKTFHGDHNCSANKEVKKS